MKLRLKSETVRLTTNRVTAAREKSGMTLREFSAKIKVPLATLWRVERGGIPELTTAIRIAKGLKLRVEDIWQ